LAHRRVVAFDELHRRTPAAQRPGLRQAGNSGADNEHSDTLAPHGASIVCGWSISCRSAAAPSGISP